MFKVKLSEFVCFHEKNAIGRPMWFTHYVGLLKCNKYLNFRLCIYLLQISRQLKCSVVSVSKQDKYRRLLLTEANQTCSVVTECIPVNMTNCLCGRTLRFISCNVTNIVLGFIAISYKGDGCTCSWLHVTLYVTVTWLRITKRYVGRVTLCSYCSFQINNN